MLKYKILIWLFNIKLSLCNCHTEIKQSGFKEGRGSWSATKIGILPKEINESSGLIQASDSTYWTINDGGGKNVLYEVTKKGEALRTQVVENTTNVDWEELTIDDKGTIFIGDFGNNTNDRRNMTIYKVDADKGFSAERLMLHYANQETFPAHRNAQIFDCEAMLAVGDSLYLFSKNRGRNRAVQLYALKATEGSYVLVPKDEIYLKAQVTGAAMSPDGKTFVLLAYGKLYFFESSLGKINFDKPTYCVKMPLKQAESVLFERNNHIIITNEQGEIWQLCKN